MLNLKLIETNFEEFNRKLIAKKVSQTALKKLLDSYNDVKLKKINIEELQALQNSKSKEVGTKARNGEDISTLKAELEENKSKIQTLSEDLNQAETHLEKLASSIPNIIDDDVPFGEDESQNVELKKVLKPKEFNFTPKHHYELGEKLGWLDFERGVKLSGSRFTAIKGDGAKINRALVNYMIDFNLSRGFELVNIPFLVRSEILYGTGQLPKFEDDLYKADENLYLIPTSEVPVTNLYNDEILNSDCLPQKFTCYSHCFRKEAGSAGRDTRGMIRQHQFEKVELVCLTKQDQSDKIFDEMVSCASDLLTSLGLAHRHMLLCSGDTGFSAAKTIDLEVWLPAQNCYREISSISNCRDFQARRAKIRYKEGKKNLLAHTLNGSSLAVGRTLIAIMENYQKEDGSIEIPKVLEKYM
ncbi:MAG: serine--tRNA ligase [Campylobacter sp.]|nr:serine--tRNA ligase [Campylobacter sp.]